MKNAMKIAVLAALVPVATLPAAANAALQYTPPQAMVLTCNGTAPNVLGKTSALATFACANGQAPQAVGVTSGLGDMLGLASGAASLVASEAVPHLALPAMGGGSGAGSNGSGSGAGNGNGSSAGKGNVSNGSGNGNGSSGNGSGANAGSNGSGSGGSGSNAGNGSGSSGSGANAGSNGSGSGANGSGSGASGSGNGNGNGSSSNGSGANAGGNGSAPSSGSGGGGGWLGHLIHSVGQAAQQIGTAVVTGVASGSQATIPLFGGSGGQGTVAGGNNTGNMGTSGFSSLNRYTHPQPAAPVTFMTGAAPGTIEIHTQPQPFTLIGGPAAYRGLVRWVSGFEGSVLSVGGGGLNTVVHPGTMTPERLPSSGTSYYPYSRLSGYADFYITELGHRSVAYPGNPVRFVANIPTGGVTATIWENSQKLELSATGGFSSGPQFYTSVPGNRNGPFWPSPFTLGGPEPDIAGVCHGFKQITHVSMGGYCWSTTP